MDAYQLIREMEGARKPQSTSEKHELGASLAASFHNARYNSEVFKWIEAAALYYIDRHNLYSYVFGVPHSKQSFFEELGIPPSSARSRIALWDAYVVRYGMRLEDLTHADMLKLEKAIVHIRSKEDAHIAVELAERGKLSRADYVDTLKDLLHDELRD